MIAKDKVFRKLKELLKFSVWQMIFARNSTKKQQKQGLNPPRNPLGAIGHGV